MNAQISGYLTDQRGVVVKSGFGLCSPTGYWSSAMLDELITNIKAVSVDTIIAIGHTDRIGSDAYNLKLSERRAESVKAYLVSAGVPANRIHTEGKEKKEPVTKPDSCKGKKSPKVIACLQPDRRVVIEVVGTRSR